MPKGTGRATRGKGLGGIVATTGAITGATTGDSHAEALRILLDDEMMRSIARIGRFRVLAHETLVPEPPDPLAGHRLALIDIVDYSSDRTVSACVDLDRGGVASLRCSPGETRLAPEEEAEALTVALADRRVAGGIVLGDIPQAVLHVGTRAQRHAGGEPGFAHRSAAVVFGPSGSARQPSSLVAVVDLARSVVTRVVPPEAL